MNKPNITKIWENQEPAKPIGFGAFCDFCTREVMVGEHYLDTGEKFICWRCANRMRRIAREE